MTASDSFHQAASPREQGSQSGEHASPAAAPSAGGSARKEMIRCGDCANFVRDGKCRFFDTPEGRAKDRPFEHAPFWVWSDCYSDKEQVRANVKTMCSTFKAKA